MKLLYTQKNVLSATGGGESAVVRMLGLLEECLIYFPYDSKEPLPSFSHFRPLRLDVDFQCELRRRALSAIAEKDPLRPDFDDYVYARTLARSVRGMFFDVVESPDYLTHGRFLRVAFARERVQVGKFVLGLHGRVSRTLELENETNRVCSDSGLERLKARERSCFAAADVRYGISESYREELCREQDLPVQLVDPLAAVPSQVQIELEPSRAPAFLSFVGRLEWGKGPDVLLRLVERNPGLFSERYRMYGSAACMGKRPLLQRLAKFCHVRGIPFNYRGSVSYTLLQNEVYNEASVAFISSRADTFNLVALESLYSGRPALISKHAGAAAFVEREFPNLEAAQVIDISDMGTLQESAEHFLRDYRELQYALLKTLRESRRSPDLESLHVVYQSSSSSCPRASAGAESVVSTLESLLCSFEGKPVSDGPVYQVKREVKQSKSSAILRELSYLNPRLDDVFAFSRDARRSAFDLYRDIKETIRTDKQGVRLREVYRTSPYLGRYAMWRELSNIERRHGDFLKSAAYLLRLNHRGMLSKRDSLFLELQKMLQAEGCHEEARAFAIRDAGSLSRERVFEYLKGRQRDLRSVTYEPDEYRESFVEAQDEPKVSIIVSLYDVDQRHLSHFVDQLSLDSFVASRQAELLFVDSGSPSAQIELIKNCRGIERLSWRIIRSRERETIQKAWNRGIAWARSPYITFLGVDEGVRQDAFRKLSEALDRSPDVDWVMSDAVVEDVGICGNWVADVLSYLRAPLSSTAPLFDCTFLGYVGGLYRRSVHERFGYYDASFKGAGDTEFKCRVLPSIRTLHFPETLGVFYNFPVDRVTNSARIEIEDSRAWYLFRTEGGLDYLMERMSEEEMETFFWEALSIRRTWSRLDAEGDLLFAGRILRRLLESFPKSSVHVLWAELNELGEGLKTLQGLQPNGVALGWSAFRLIKKSREFYDRCRSTRSDLAFPNDFRTDIEFFSHDWLW